MTTGPRFDARLHLVDGKEFIINGHAGKTKEEVLEAIKRDMLRSVVPGSAYSNEHGIVMIDKVTMITIEEAAI